MAERQVAVTLVARTAAYQAQMRAAAASNTQFGASAAATGAKTASMTGRMQGLAASSGLMNTKLVGAAGLLYGLKEVTGSALEWESAFAGVEKTVDGTAGQMSALSDGLRQMSTEIPTSAVELASIAEAAGQLGIKTPDVLDFTRVMADLGETTNLTSTEAATSLARFMNVMQSAPGDVERLGSTLVELGNNSETTESEILELATRMAAAGQIAGLSESDVMAFAATLTSVGVEAEAGGTALSKVFTSIRDAVLDGGDNLTTFARVAQMSADNFAEAFRADPADAVNMFIQGLGRMNDAGESTSAVFADLSLTDQRLMRALLSTASAGDHLTDRLEMANDAFRENNALQEEAAARYETNEAKIEVAKNSIKDLAVEVGGQFASAVGKGAEGLTWLTRETDFAAIAANMWGINLFGARQEVDAMTEAASGQAVESARWQAQADAYAESTAGLGDAAHGTGDALEEMGESAYTSSEGLFELDRLLNDLIGTQLAAESATIAWERSLDDLTESVDGGSDALDLNTAKGRDNRQAMSELASDLLGVIQTRHDEGATVTETAMLYDDLIGQYRQAARDAGLTEDQVDQLIDTYGLTPDEVVTSIVAEDRASGIIGNVIAQLGRIPKVSTTTIRTINEQKISGPRARGGPVSAGNTYLVGEEGPELVTFPNAGYVHDAQASQRMMQPPPTGAAARPSGSVSLDGARIRLVVNGAEFDAYLDQSYRANSTRQLRWQARQVTSMGNG